MTTVDILFHFSSQPSERSMLALARTREVYGVRRVAVDERARTISIEYDATRMGEATVRQLVRRTGIMIVDPPAA